MSELEFILSRNNITRREWLKEYISECKKSAEDENLSENERLAFAFQYAKSKTIFKQLYPFEKIRERI